MSLESVCFVHDHPFRYDRKGRCYSPGVFSTQVWERYLSFANRLTVCGRAVQIDKADIGDRFLRLDHPDVSFVKLPNIMDPRRHFRAKAESKQALRSLIGKHEAVIARLPSEHGLLAIQICEKLGKPYFIEVAGDVWDALWNLGSLAGRLYAPIQTFRVRRAIKRAPFTLYVTREALQRRYPSDGEQTHASNVVLPKTDDDVLRLRKERNDRSDGPIRVGIIGAPEVKYKGLHIAAESLKVLIAEGHDLELRLLGQGNSQSVDRYMQKLGIAYFAIYDGTLPSGDPVAGWLDNLDIYLQPSLQEGLPRATVEAMSRGLVAVGSDVAGIPELLQPQHIFRRSHHSELTTIVRRLLGNRQAWNDISEKNFQSSKDYTVSAISKRRDRFYRKFAEYAKTRNAKG